MVFMQRLIYLDRIKKAFKTSKVVAILGPRQCGKTTLARQYFQLHQGRPENYFDLEDPTDLLRLKDPLLGLSELEGLIVIDEIQRLQDLFTVLRVLVDKKNKNQQYLILGSASRELIKQSAESLAGRIHYMELTPFSYEEVDHINQLWIRGGFPLSYLANTEEESLQWRKDYVRTFLEQDIPNLGIKIPATNLRRFWMMLAHYHGQLLNASELGNALDISHHTVKNYLDILTGTFMVRQLMPWHENIAKRQVKSKKIYFRDSGIFHTLLGVTDHANLLVNPKIGASWEGFALEAVIRHLGVDQFDCYFWGVHGQAELDLLIFYQGKRLGFEFKFTKTPTYTKSMQTAFTDLKLDQLIVIYPGNKEIKLQKNISCYGLEQYLNSNDS
jgi:predicted AAA+ superfamily ATPase